MVHWSPLQIDIYKDIVKSYNNFITIDATGSVVQKLQRQNQKSGEIFLYQAVASGVSQIVPLFQMLSEKHDANIILIKYKVFYFKVGSVTKRKYYAISPIVSYSFFLL